MRGGLENRELKWGGDISLKKNEEGTEYLEMSERVTKTRTGETSKRQRPFKPKQFAHKTQSNDCPVTAYKKYASHRPLKMDFPEAPFYLAINHFRKVETDWYKCQPLGEHKLSSMMRTMYEKADIPGRKTNHSARKTTCTKLLHAGVASTVIQQLTGHQNVQSINNYAKASNEMQHNMSDILSGHKENLTPVYVTAPVPVSVPETVPTKNAPVPGCNIRSSLSQSNSAVSDHILQYARLMNCKITINNQYESASEIKPKRRRIMIESDSD